MNGTETVSRTRQRLAVLVEHLIEHTQDHANDLSEARTGLAQDVTAMELLDKALADLATAQRSLAAFRDCVIAGA